MLEAISRFTTEWTWLNWLSVSITFVALALDFFCLAFLVKTGLELRKREQELRAKWASLDEAYLKPVLQKRLISRPWKSCWREKND